MKSSNDTWYTELYRIFSSGTLLTVAQTLKLGECMRAIKAGENAQYHLNELLVSVGRNEELAEQLEEYIRSYIKSQSEEDDMNEENNEGFTY